MTTGTFRCRDCDQEHPGPPMAFASPAPDFWLPEFADDPESFLEEELCVIQRKAYFVRALIEIPVHDAPDSFSWNVWVSLSRDSMRMMTDHWETPGREADPSYFGWLSTELLPYAPTTVNLKTRVHTRPLGERPVVELEPTGHPLAVEQREGITLTRVQEFAEAYLHAG